MENEKKWYFIDWRPYNTIPIENRIIRRSKLCANDLSKFLNSAGLGYLASPRFEIVVKFVARIDGLFVFSIETRIGVPDRIAVRTAKFVSDFIKTNELKHQHDVTAPNPSPFSRSLPYDFLDLEPVQVRKFELEKMSMNSFYSLEWKSKNQELNFPAMLQLRHSHLKTLRTGFKILSDDRISTEIAYFSWTVFFLLFIAYFSILGFSINWGTNIYQSLLAILSFVFFVLSVTGFIKIYLIRIPGITLLRRMERFFIYTNTYSHLVCRDAASSGVKVQNAAEHDYHGARDVVSSRLYGESEAMQSHQAISRIYLAVSGIFFSLLVFVSANS